MIPIVFVHLGKTHPPYWKDSVQQARQWNPTAPIICIADSKGEFDASEQWVLCADLPRTPLYERFCETTQLDSKFRDGFWRFTTERLFWLHLWMRETGIKEVLHVENDNPLFFNVEEYSSSFRASSPGLLAPFHGQGASRNGISICFSILYCNSQRALEFFLIYLTTGANREKDEMGRGGQYWEMNPEDCGWLPTVPPGTSFHSDTYAHWSISNTWPIVFDAAAHGQYMGGEDPRNGPAGPGFVNPDCDYRTDQFVYGWKVDEAGRRYPVLLDSDSRPWRLANLHIHCKRVAEFRS